ncbi:MAG TPA: polysaccharide biosynthesis tyrosine autokinase [Bryobacteraceae bacterium]|nr:polysaccharide biosynthesis tyrosine autokinase [Bryobacteraceae bacterium]
MTEPKAIPAPSQTIQPAWYGYDIEPPEPPVPLAHYLWILRRHWWQILGFAAACAISVWIVSARLKPLYESSVTVDIDPRMPAGIVGQDAARAPFNDADQFLATQVKLIQSDSVMRPVVQQFHLLDRPSTAADAPVTLKQLKVTRPPNTYLLLISYRSSDAHLAADVANAVANSYVEHTYKIRFRSSAALASFMEKQLEELKAKMERSSAALARFERELNVINPEERTSILSARLLQLNTEYTNAQTDRVRKETAWRAVESGSLEAAQVSTQGENLKAIDARLEETRAKFAEVRTHYGANHPEYRKAAAQVAEIERQLQQSRQNAAGRVEVEYREAVSREDMLAKAVAETKAEFDRLNARSFQYQALKRDADADKSLYEELVRRIKEAGINAGFENSAIRIADPARAAMLPVSPNIKLNVILAFMFSTLLAAAFAIAADFLDTSVRDPGQARALLQTDVIGTLPMVKPAGIASPATADGAFAEAVGTLRNSILLASSERRPRSLMITSATPAEGKTTTAVHLAIMHARQKHKTLLIDCDLRQPGVHAMLGIAREAGLTAVLQNGLKWREKLVKIQGVDDLDILPAGPSSRASAGLIGQRLPAILEEAKYVYDLIVVDSPPMLGIPEPLQMAAAVDGVVLIARAGKTSFRTVATALTALERVRAKVIGVVLNSVSRNMSDGLHGSYRRLYR